jgi:hypothetical protein
MNNPHPVLGIEGKGIINNSRIAQTFVAGTDATGNGSLILFAEHAAAGRMINFVTEAEAAGGRISGTIEFTQYSSVGNASFYNSGCFAQGVSGITLFENQSSADKAIIISCAVTRCLTNKEMADSEDPPFRSLVS